MSDPIKVYPPKGGAPITPHPSEIDEMLSKGWTLENTKKAVRKQDQTTITDGIPGWSI